MAQKATAHQMLFLEICQEFIHNMHVTAIRNRSRHVSSDACGRERTATKHTQRGHVLMIQVVYGCSTHATLAQRVPEVPSPCLE